MKSFRYEYLCAGILIFLGCAQPLFSLLGAAQFEAYGRRYLMLASSASPFAKYGQRDLNQQPQDLRIVFHSVGGRTRYSTLREETKRIRGPHALKIHHIYYLLELSRTGGVQDQRVLQRWLCEDDVIEVIIDFELPKWPLYKSFPCPSIRT